MPIFSQKYKSKVKLTKSINFSLNLTKWDVLFIFILLSLKKTVRNEVVSRESLSIISKLIKIAGRKNKKTWYKGVEVDCIHVVPVEGRSVALTEGTGVRLKGMKGAHKLKNTYAEDM